MQEILLRMKVQTAGDCTITPYRNNTAGSDILTLSMTEEVSGDIVRRHRVGVQIQNQQIGLKFQNNTASQSFYPLDLGLNFFEKGGR